MNSKKKRKLIAGVLVAASATLCITGSLAFFTDRADGTVFAKAGTMDMVFTDTSSSKTGENGILSNNEFAIDGTWENNALVSEGMIINPGDFFDVSYNLSNAGNKSMDIRQKITITSEEPMFQMLSTFGMPTPTTGAIFNGGYYLTDAAGDFVTTRGESTENYFYDPIEDDYITFNGVVSADGKSITYELPDTTLCGVGTAAEDAGIGDLTWDFEAVKNNETNQNGNVKISNLTPTKEELVGKIVTLVIDGYGTTSGSINVLAEIPEMKITLFKVRDENENMLSFEVFYEGNIEGVTPGIYVTNFGANGATGTGTIESVGGFDSELDNNYILHFAGMSGNEFQGKGVTVKLDIQAKQHHNTGEDTWVDWASYETTVEKVN